MLSGRLVLGLDGKLPGDLNGFVAQRVEILEGLRIAICNRLIETVEFGDAHMLGRIAYECNYLSVGGTQIATAGRRLCGPNSLSEGLVGLSIDYFEFGHHVGLWLGLRVQPVHGR